MEINEMNYELYAIDYAEGRLTGDTLKAMETFLSAQPEIAAEIAAICSTVVPAETSLHGDLASLKRDRSVIAILPVVWSGAAAAAAVLLIFGLFLVNDRFSAPYGELAADRPSFTVHFSVEHIYRTIGQGTTQEDPGTELLAGRAAQLPSFPREEPAIESQADAIAAGGEAGNSIADNRGKGQKERTNDAVPYRVKMTIVDPADVPVDDYYVLPVTIELHQLSEDAGRQIRQQLDELAALEDARNTRRKQWRDGALSLLQDTFVPTGVGDMINN